jgi:beta-glucanase (GH16 family)
VKEHQWVFDHPFFFIMNLAVGGNWPGNPDKTTVFPQELRFDYVHVYQRVAQS